MKKKLAKAAYRSYLTWGICSSLSVTFCTLIDAALIGNFVGSEGLAVESMVTPVFMIYGLFGVTIGTGTNVLIGRALGASDREQANHLMKKQLAIGLICGIVLLVFSLIFRNGLFRMLGADDNLITLVSDYLLPVLISTPLFILYHILSASVRSDGDSHLAGIASLVVVFVNLTLDFIFMGVLSWGIRGASVSLCIAELCGVLLLLTHFGRKLSILHLGLELPSWTDVRVFLSNGFGVGSTYIFQAIVMLVFNRLLLSDPVNGVTWEAIFGVLYTLSTVPLACHDGAGGALAPVISIYAGEKDGDNILTVLQEGLLTIALSAVVFLVIFECFTQPILQAFGLEGSQLLAAVPVLRFYSLCFLFSGFNILMTSFWQTIGRSSLAGCMSILRNFVIVLLLGCLLIPQMGVMGLAVAYVCSEALCFVCVVVLGEVIGFFRKGQKQKQVMGQSAMDMEPEYEKGQSVADMETEHESVRPAADMKPEHGRNFLAASTSGKYVMERYSPSGRVFEKYYNIRTESIGEIADDLNDLCGIWEVKPRQEFFLNFIVEEIILNIIKFGLEDGSDRHYVDIKVLEGEDTLTLCIRDDVKAYNPFEANGDAVDLAVLHTIQEKTHYCDYQRKLVFNYLYLVL